MYISCIKLQNFKSYENVTIAFDSKFNVLIGENNIGKTTVFEALRLWKRCYSECINARGNDFYADSVALYIAFEDLYFLRLTKGTDLFYGQKRSCEITLVFNEEDTNSSYELGFKLSVPQITDSYIRLSRMLPDQFTQFKDRMDTQNIRLQEFLFIQQTAPVANVLSKEPYMYRGQVVKKIEKGKSDEVLRNKILQSLNKGSNLKTWMQEVLDITFDFKIPPRSARERDEYIDLQIEQNGKKIDIYLQGSGFLQTAEILSTIDIMDNALNVMLIDEPDSHISPRIQNKLLRRLMSIPNVQTFVISHNDNFVSEVNPSNILFVNDENKTAGNIVALDDINIDSLHTSLGGIISGLTRLQSSKKVVFVEGDDDISYLQKLNNAMWQIGSQYAFDFNKISFWFVRGKDYIPQKIRTGKQLISQAVNGCKYGVIFDKDFCTTEVNSIFKENLGRSLGTGNFVHTHNGYCIESVLFSDKYKLETFLNKILPDTNVDLHHFIEEKFINLQAQISNVSSGLYDKMKNKFISQKKPQRPEMQNVEFDKYAAESANDIQYLMNKDNIKEFVMDLERETHQTLFPREEDSSESVASGLLETYINSLSEESDLYTDYIVLMQTLHSFLS